ncbi:hypothetical protein FFRU_260070 [Fructobacillus fructosus]|uniref:hypothetical protein n=1 Tax=Fructobacillus fructosus TaxID=1631 RepID=UPI0002195CB2|nr:hypothetical protein [Fructobacillus fructosus]KRN50773.1 hypothetical protein IV71_GL000775 [Fructobacillus fructosus KCTC 3544]GAP02025.1 hypothetical protein FFRU_260070 [Fructobacillus fructosus]
MVFENKKYGIRSMNGPLSDEAAKMIAKLMAKMVADHFEEKEDEKMTKKFTEEEYQKIVEIADRLLDDKNRADIELSTLDEIYFRIQKSSNAEENNKFKDLNQELALIALPKSRDWAHDQFVEKEKRYYWKYKKTDNGGKRWVLTNRYGIITTWCDTDDGYLEDYKKDETYLLSKKEVVEAGYNPDMFDREEVE